MDYGSNITKDMLRQIYNLMPNTMENQDALGALMDAINSANIDARAYTYNAVYSAAGAANALAAGVVNVPVQINIQADADFLILNQTFSANTLNAAQTYDTAVLPNVSVIITDTASSANMMDQAVPVPSIFGTGQLPYILPAPKLLRASSNLQVSVSNYDAAAGYNLRLSFNGIKLFKFN